MVTLKEDKRSFPVPRSAGSAGPPGLPQGHSSSPPTRPRPRQAEYCPSTAAIPSDSNFCYMKRIHLLLLSILLTLSTFAQDFPIVSHNGDATPIYVDPNDHWLVRHSAELLQADIERVTGKRPAILHTPTN